MPNSYLGYIIPEAEISESTIQKIILRTKDEISLAGLTMTGGRFTLHPEPELSTDLATKNYVDINGGSVFSGRVFVSEWVSSTVPAVSEFPCLAVWQNWTFFSYLDDVNQIQVLVYDNTLPPVLSQPLATITNNLPNSGPLPCALQVGDDYLYILVRMSSLLTSIYRYPLLGFFNNPATVLWELVGSFGLFLTSGAFLKSYPSSLYFNGSDFTGVRPVFHYNTLTGSRASLGPIFYDARDFAMTSNYVFWVKYDKLYRSTYALNPSSSVTYFVPGSVTATEWMGGNLLTVYKDPTLFFGTASLTVWNGYVYVAVGNENGAIYRASVDDEEADFTLYVRGVDEVVALAFDSLHVYTVSDNVELYNYVIGRGYNGPDSFVTNPFIANADANSKRIINLANPINDQDAVTKSFLVSAIGTVVANIAPTLTDLTSAVTVISEDVSDLQTEAVVIDGRLETLEIDVSTLQTGAVVSNGKIVTLETDVNTLQTTTTVSDGKITTLQNTTVKNPMLATLNMNGFGVTNALSIVGNLANTFELTRVRKIGGVANLALQIALGTNSVLSVTGGNADMGGAEITSLGAPSLPSSAASRQYIDNQYTSLLSTLTNQRIYYNSTQRLVTFHNNLNSGISTQGTLTFERIGNHVRVSIPVFVVRIGTVAIPYIEVLNAFPAWAAAPSSGQVLPCIVNYRGVNAAVMGRVRFADTNIRFYNDLTDGNWSEAKGGNVAEHGTAHPAVYTYLGAPLKTPPNYKGSAVFGSDPVGPGDILWPP